MDVLNTTMASFEEFSEATSVGNFTSEINWTDQGKTKSKFIMIALTAFVTFGMGCDVDYKIFMHHLKRPIGITVGIVCQFLIMPMLGLGYKYILGIEDAFAIGALIVSSCPGGSLSNIITYYVDGEVSLSIAMTTASNTLAMGMMPMWLYIYKVVLHLEDTLTTPFVEIIIGVIIIMAPAAIGMIVHSKYTKVAKILSKVCAGVGIFSFVILAIVNFMSMKFKIVILPKIIAMSCAHPLSGMILALIASSFACFKLSNAERKAIALECGIQNPLLAMAILNFSFSTQLEILQNNYFTPLLYSASTIAISILIILILKVREKLLEKSSTSEKEIAEGEHNEGGEEAVALKTVNSLKDQ